MSSYTSSSSARTARNRAGARFLLFWAAAVAGAFLAIGAFNAWVDPLGRLGYNTMGIYHSSEFEYKLSRMPVATFDGILIGSSKVANIDPDGIPNVKLFNAGFSGALPEEMFQLLQANEAYLRNKFVLVGLDFFMFNERTKSSRGDRLISPRPSDVLAYILSIRTTYFSLQTVLKHVRGEEARMKVNGARHITDLLEEDRRLDAPDYGTKINDILRSLYGDYEFSTRRVEIMQRMRAFLEGNGIAYSVILNPQNETLIAAVRDAGLGATFDRYRQALKRVFPNLVDLSESDLSGTPNFFHQSPFYFRIPVMKEMVLRGLRAADENRAKLIREKRI